MNTQIPGITTDVLYIRLTLVSAKTPDNVYEGRFDPASTYTIDGDNNGIETNTNPVIVAYAGNAVIAVPDHDGSSVMCTAPVTVTIDPDGVVWLPVDTWVLIGEAHS